MLRDRCAMPIERLLLVQANIRGRGQHRYLYRSAKRGNIHWYFQHFCGAEQNHPFIEIEWYPG